MPPWITSLLRDEVPVPIASAASATITSCPASAAARAIASPTTPAPTTRTCIPPALLERSTIRSADGPAGATARAALPGGTPGPVALRPALWFPFVVPVPLFLFFLLLCHLVAVFTFFVLFV